MTVKEVEKWLNENGWNYKNGSYRNAKETLEIYPIINAIVIAGSCFRTTVEIENLQEVETDGYYNRYPKLLDKTNGTIIYRGDTDPIISTSFLTHLILKEQFNDTRCDY